MSVLCLWSDGLLLSLQASYLSYYVSLFKSCPFQGLLLSLYKVPVFVNEGYQEIAFQPNRRVTPRIRQVF